MAESIFRKIYDQFSERYSNLKYRWGINEEQTLEAKADASEFSKGFIDFIKKSPRPDFLKLTKQQEIVMDDLAPEKEWVSLNSFRDPWLTVLHYSEINHDYGVIGSAGISTFWDIKTGTPVFSIMMGKILENKVEESEFVFNPVKAENLRDFIGRYFSFKKALDVSDEGVMLDCDKKALLYRYFGDFDGCHIYAHNHAEE